MFHASPSTSKVPRALRPIHIGGLLTRRRATTVCLPPQVPHRWDAWQKSNLRTGLSPGRVRTLCQGWLGPHLQCGDLLYSCPPSLRPRSIGRDEQPEAVNGSLSESVFPWEGRSGMEINGRTLTTERTGDHRVQGGQGRTGQREEVSCSVAWVRSSTLRAILKSGDFLE